VDAAAAFVTVSESQIWRAWRSRSSSIEGGALTTRSRGTSVERTLGVLSSWLQTVDRRENPTNVDPSACRPRNRLLPVRLADLV
jgi:hypothetical protein